jgi:hypothetical protein
LKKCPDCGSVNSDGDSICGVCGRGLSEAGSESPAGLAVTRESKSKSSRLRRRSLFAIVTVTVLTLIGAGLYILMFVSLFGVVILLPGVVLLIFLLDSPNVKAGEGYGPQRTEVLREEEEERQRETGEAD